MNEPTRKIPPWSWALLLLPVLLLLSYTYFANSGSSGGAAGGELSFDPSGVKELEIKGVAAGGESSWDEIPVSAAPSRDEKLLARLPPHAELAWLQIEKMLRGTAWILIWNICAWEFGRIASVSGTRRR